MKKANHESGRWSARADAVRRHDDDVAAPSPVAAKPDRGAADPVSAVRGFLAAAKEPDLQAMGVLWGDSQGPARDAIRRATSSRSAS